MSRSDNFDKGQNDAAFEKLMRDNNVTVGGETVDSDKAKDIANQLFSGMENIFGSYKKSVQGDAYDRIRASGYHPGRINIDEEGDPHVVHESGEWHAKWYGGPYFDVFHNSRPDQAIDTIHVGSEAAKDKRGTNHQALKDWISENGDEFKEHQLPYL